MSKPTVPVELESEIFEITARTHRGTGTRLALVARRVQFRIEPIMYEMVTLDTPTKHSRFMFAISSKPKSFFQKYVKTLCLQNGRKQQNDLILSICTGVVNLACWHADSQLRHLVGTEILLRLSIDLGTLILGSGGPDLPYFPNVTHLDMIGPYTGKVLHMFPSLTHIAFNVSKHNIFGLELLPNLLSAFSSLEIVLILIDDLDDVSEVSFAGVDSVYLRDPRLVLLVAPNSVSDWEVPVHGQPDMWMRAKEILKRRKRARGLSRVAGLSVQALRGK